MIIDDIGAVSLIIKLKQAAHVRLFLPKLAVFSRCGRASNFSAHVGMCRA